ncbi:peptidase domain-containing ABC transporter, partial [Calothrix rhizosoleniae]|uniref:peptidase domain-containing ABC transporter n=1 Tax=Calothrix rhizosoleniae TaxID=888997 RepID=UPI000B49FCDD
MKYTCIEQHSEEDCGAACIATIAKHHGRTFAISRVREAVGTGQLGTTLLGLRRGAESFGFDAFPVQASSELIDCIEEAPLPAIIHWKGNHWVVLYGRKGKKYVIADPAVGIRYLSRQELSLGWANGVMLFLVPDEIRFYQQENDKIQGFRRFLLRVWHYRSTLLEALLLNFILGLLSLALPFVIQVLTDDVLVRSDIDLLKTVVIGASSLIIFSSILRLVQSNLIVHFSQRLELGLMLEFGRQLLQLPLSYFESHRSGEIVSRLRDIREINFLVAQVVITLPTEGLIALVSLFVMLLYSFKLFSVALTVSFLMTLPTLLFLPILKQKTRDVLVTAAENQGVLVETFKGSVTLKTTHTKLQIWDDLQSRFGKLAHITFRTMQLSIFTSVLSNLASGLGTIAILGFGSLLVMKREFTIGQLLAFNNLNLNLILFINRLVTFADEFARAQTATQRLGEIIQATPETINDSSKSWAKISANADIICSHICFYHLGRVDLFDNFSVTIPGGKVTAIIGKSGCGKSTLAKLIASLYQPLSGNIRFGRFNQGDLALDYLRQQIVL